MYQAVRFIFQRQRLKWKVEDWKFMFKFSMSRSEMHPVSGLSVEMTIACWAERERKCAEDWKFTLGECSQDTVENEFHCLNATYLDMNCSIGEYILKCNMNCAMEKSRVGSGVNCLNWKSLLKCNVEPSGNSAMEKSGVGTGQWCTVNWLNWQSLLKIGYIENWNATLS